RKVPPAPASALVPKRKWPAELMGNRAVLMSRDVAFGINDAGGQYFAPLLSHLIGVIVPLNRRPKRSVGKLFIPERGFGARTGIVMPEKFPQSCHLLLVTGHGKFWKIIRRRGCRSAGVGITR